MTYELVWRRYRVRLRGGVRLTHHGQPGTVRGTANMHLRLRMDPDDAERLVHPLDPALDYPPPPRVRVMSRQGWRVHAATPHTPVWPGRILCDQPLTTDTREVDQARPVTCKVCGDRLPRFPGPRLPPPRDSTGSETATIHQALETISHRPGVVWAQLRHLLSVAAQDLTQVERANVHDPDQDTGRVLPHPVTVQALVLARSLREPSQGPHRAEDAHPTVHLLQAAQAAEQWNTPLGWALAEMFEAAEVTWPRLDGPTATPAQSRARAATHRAALTLLNQEDTR